MKFQWISWYQPTEDYRPLTYPPGDAILGWWCTGSNEVLGATLCALVAADSEEAARAIVRTDWPEATDWRFCEAVDDPAQISATSRFIPSGWMQERFASNGITTTSRSKGSTHE